MVRLLTGYKTKTEAVYEALRESIISGELPPGKRLVIRDLANELDVSEIPVREALRRLETEGLIESTPYVGAVVSAPSIKDLQDIMAIRGALEALAAELSGPNLTGADIERLLEIASEMERCVDAERFWEYSKHDREFHSLLYSKCGNEKLLKAIEDLWTQSERARAIFNVVALSARQSLDEHRAMLDCLASQDFKGLSELVKAQKQRVGYELSSIASKYGPNI